MVALNVVLSVYGMLSDGGSGSGSCLVVAVDVKEV